MRTEKCDIIVIGGGSAAFEAAVSARKAGAERVIMLEKAPEAEYGGNARYSGTGAATLDFPASLVFKGSQLYLTNASLFDDGINSRILPLQAAFPGWPLN